LERGAPKAERSNTRSGACMDGVPEHCVKRSIRTPGGEVVAIACDDGLLGVWLGRVRDAELSRDWAALEAAAMDVEHRVLDQFERELGAYFRGELRAFDVPRVIRGTAYQERVWEELVRVPLGATISYGELARRVGDADGARSAAAACGANRLPIVIPCHRVVAADGSLWGFSAGLEWKRALLDHEAKVTGRYEPTLFEG